MKPAYEKAAKSLEGLAQVVAVNCDDEDSKAFCGKMGIKGFPTLKTVRITGTLGKPIIMDYQGPRTASGIVDAVKKLITNNVKRLEDKELDGWLKDNNETAKALLFSDKGSTSALVKVLANDYIGNLHFAQVRDKEVEANSMFGIKTYPTLVVLPGGNKPAVVYDGEMKKPAMNEFISKYAALRDLSASTKKSTKKDKTPKEPTDKKASGPSSCPFGHGADSVKASSDSSTFAEASASYASAEASDAAASGTTITVSEPEFTESPEPFVGEDAPTPVPVPEVAPPLPTLETQEELQKQCLGPKTPTCILALLPNKADPEAELPEQATAALSSLADLSLKHKTRGSHLFPFFAVSSTNLGGESLKSALGLSSDEVQLIAVSGKRGWWREFGSEKGYGNIAVEGWVDGIRFGEGKKEKLPEGLVVVPGEEEKPTEEAPVEERPVEEINLEEEGSEKPPIIHEEL